MDETDTKGKGVRRVTLYFFSTDLKQPVQPLTIENVKNAFPKNHKLHNELDKYFKKDQGLSCMTTGIRHSG